MNQTNSQTTYRDRLELTGEIFFDYFLPIFVGFALLFFCVYFVQFYVIADVNRFVTKLAAPPHPVFQPSIQHSFAACDSHESINTSSDYWVLWLRPARKQPERKSSSIRGNVRCSDDVLHLPIYQDSK
jgi:hypothetical protein